MSTKYLLFAILKYQLFITMSKTTQKKAARDLVPAYNNMTRNQQTVAKDTIMQECEIDLRKFYRWLREPRLIRRPDRLIFAKAFGLTEEELFENW